MALQEQQIVVPFRGGVETKEDRKGVLPTKLLALENAVFTKAVSTVKRFGYEDLGDDVMGSETAAPAALALGKRGAELLAFSADQAHSWLDDAGQWIGAGDLRSVVTSMATVAKTGTNQTMADRCAADGIALYAWEDSAGGVWYALLDDETGRSIVPPTQAEAGGSRPRCIALGSAIFCVYALTPTRELRLLHFSLASPTSAPVETAIVTDLSHLAPGFDLAKHGDNALLVWARDNNKLGLAYLHSSGVIGGAGLGLPVPVSIDTVVNGPVSIASDGSSRAAVAWIGRDPITRSSVTVANLDTNASTADGNAFATASVTLTANKPCLIAITSARLSSAVPQLPVSVVGPGGRTFTMVSSVNTFESIQAQTLSWWLGVAATTDTGTINFSFVNNHSSASWSAVELTGADPSSTVVQFKTGATYPSQGTQLSATFDAALEHANSLSLLAYNVPSSTQTVAPLTTETLIAQAGVGFASTRVGSLYGVAGATTVGAQHTNSPSAPVAGEVGIIALEIRAATTITDSVDRLKQLTVNTTTLASVHAARTLADSSGATQVTCAFDGRLSSGGFGTLWAFCERSAAAVQNYTTAGYRVDVDPAALTLHDSWTQRGCGLASKAFLHGTDCYVHLGRDSTFYRTYYTVRARSRLVVARLLSGLGNGHLSRSHLPGVQFDSTAAEWVWPAIYVTDIESPDGDVFTESGIKRVSLEFSSDEAFRSIEIGGTTYIAGGMLHAYDGQRVVEAEFHYGIDDVAAPTQGAPTGTGLANGTYGYIFALENVLANGEIQRGPVSIVTTVVVTGGPRRVTFAVPTYRLTAMPNARIACYRSLNGDASLYSRVSSWDPSTAGAVNGYVANSTTVDTVTFVDEMPDAVLEAQDGLYINGGIPSNEPLGGAKLVASGKGRAFVVDAAEPLRVYFAQERAGGFTLETTPALRIEVDAHGGDVSGVVVMDESVVIFKETAIFHVTGPGPLANPDMGGGWALPELISSDVGCISPDSICQAPMGIVFQSRKGIYLLGRDFQVSYLGASVEAYNAQTVTAATLIEDRTQIRFLTSAGATLSYDYERGQWSTFTNHEGADAILVGGEYHYLRGNGRVWRETTAYADGNAHIKKVVETAWINLTGHKQGLDRLWHATILGEYKSAHTLRVYWQFDYEAGWAGPPIDIDPTEGRDEALYGDGIYGAGVYGGAPDTRYQFQLHVGQECQAIRFRFEDVEANADYGASFELTELHLNGGVERSNFTVEEARRY